VLAAGRRAAFAAVRRHATAERRPVRHPSSSAAMEPARALESQAAL